MCTVHDMEPDKPFCSMDLESVERRPPRRRCGAVLVLMSSVAKIVSAGLYLSDFVTNIVVLREYFILGSSRGSFEGGQIGYNSYSAVFYIPVYVCLGLMLVDPVLTALAFKLKLPPEERPLRSAMFLPIVQFLRFVKGLYRTCSCARAVETKESEETEALYAITATIQTGPQLALQTSVIFWVTVLTIPSAFFDPGGPTSVVYWKPSAALILSIICSFLSACYNSGRACMYQISNKWSVIPNMAGIAGGVYTVGVVLLRCTVVVSLLSAPTLLRETSTMNIMYLVLYLVLGIGMCSYANALLVAFSKRQTMCSWATQAEILLNTYNSACIGPLYPIVENDNQSSCNDQRWSMRMRIAVGVAINMLPDVVSLFVLVIQKQTSCDRWNQDSYVGIKFIFSCGLFNSYVAIGLLLSILSSVALYFIAKGTSPHNALKTWSCGPSLAGFLSSLK